MKRRPGSGTWPASRWSELLRLALDLLATLPPGLTWSFGGGTRLALIYDHRISYDVDIFVQDSQVIGWLTPRLNDAAAALFGESYEEDNAFIKFRADGGEIDVVVARELTRPGIEMGQALGTDLPMQTPEEIIAKKIQFRGHAFRHRDAFDLAMLLQRDRARVDAAVAACSPVALARLRQRLDLLLPVLTSELPDYVNPTPSAAHLLTDAAPIIRAWLDA